MNKGSNYTIKKRTSVKTKKNQVSKTRRNPISKDKFKDIKNFKKFISSVIKSCNHSKTCYDKLFNYPYHELLIYKAIELKLIDIIGCNGYFDEFNFIDRKGISQVYAVCKNKKKCNKIIAKIIDDDHEKEPEILRLLTKNIVMKDVSPNIAVYYSHIKCDNNSRLISSYKFNESFNKNKYKTSILFTEYIDGITLDDWLRKSHSLEEHLSILFQIIYTLSVLQEKYKLVHNDLHGSNIMLKKTKGIKNSYWIYNYKGKTYYIPDIGYQVKIVDFGLSSIYKKNIITDGSPKIFNKSKDLNSLYYVYITFFNRNTPMDIKAIFIYIKEYPNKYKDLYKILRMYMFIEMTNKPKTIKVIGEYKY